ncbi:MAG: peptidylprolyl isomerase [Lentisphaeria bacterium]
MTTATEGNTVKIHYTGKLQDGTVFDSSREREPLEFKVGEGQMIPGFEKAVDGMGEGEEKTFTLKPEEAYGEPRDELVAEFALSDFPDHIEPKEGMMLQLKSQDDQPMNVQVTEVTDEKVKLDGNHPLAGKELTFDIEMVEVND